jgi:hypothetical protein
MRSTLAGVSPCWRRSRPHAADVEGLLDVIEVLHPAPEPRHLLRAIGDRVAHPGLVEAGQRRRRRHPPHRRDGGLDAAVAAPNRFVSQRDDEAAAHVIAEHDRPEQLHPAAPLPLRHREGGRDDAGARVRLGQRIDVVGLVRVREHAVRQRGVDGRRPEVGRDDGSLRHAALRAHEADGHLSRPEVRPRHHRPQRVEDAVLRVHEHLGRERLLAGRHHVARELPGEIGRGGAGRARGSLGRRSGRCSRRTRRQDPGRDQARCTSQEMAARQHGRSRRYPPGRICFRSFLRNVFVHRPCVLSWFTISAMRRALASAFNGAALTSDASSDPSGVTGTRGPAGGAATGRWWDGFVFVTSWKRGAPSARTPEP